MTGIVALWNLDGSPVDAGLLRGMAGGANPTLHGAFGAAAAVCDIAAPADEGPQGPVTGTDGVVLAFDGRLDDRLELARLVDADPALRDAPLVLAAYRALGEHFLERVAGDFALVLFDPAADRLILARDAVGPRPLHYARVGATLAVASDVRTLTRHPAFAPRPHLRHFGEYLAGATPAADSGLTFLEGVETVRPGYRVLATRSAISERCFWDFPAEPVRLGSADAYRDAFRERFQEAVRRRLRGTRPVAVAVSGGVDSSSIYCMAQWLRAHDASLSPVQGLTEAHPGDPHADELSYVEEMESMYARPIHRRPGGGVGTLESWTREVWHSGVPRLHPFATAVEDRSRFSARLGAVTLMGGEWADAIVHDQGYLVDLARRGDWRTVRAHLATIPAWFQDADPRPFRRQFARDLVRTSLPGAALDGLRRLRGLRSAGEDALFGGAAAFRELLRGSREPRGAGRFRTLHGRSLYAKVRSRRAAMDLGSMSSHAGAAGLRYALPYMDRELLSFLMAIPGEAMTPGGVPKGLLRAAMQGRMPESIVQRRWKSDFTHLVRDGLSRYLATVSGYLRTHTAAVDLGLVNGSALRSLLREWEAGAASPDFWSLLQVLGLELWLQLFVGGARPSEPVPDTAPRRR